ncbi:MAG: aminotransferase class V-fold PLP-dependent enzyme, partial [Candidatus Diapherotrites archaeon]|nr:aminotransferase class V-fold PLP-dependent enzyme [Candidatus Diapherotrites archaeon]
FLAWSSHKMCGPTGVGVLYGREEALLELPPLVTGGEMISEVFYDRVTWNKLPWKFEAGTPDIAGVVGFGAAIDFVQHIGLENIAKRDLELGKKAFDALSATDGVTVLGPAPQKKVSLFSFDVVGVHPHDVATVLDNHGVAIRSGNHCAQPLLRDLGFDSVCRASFYLYSMEWEIDALIEGIQKTQALFGAKNGKKSLGKKQVVA